MARDLWDASGDALPWSECHGPQWEQDERVDRARCRKMARALLAAGWTRGGGREAAPADVPTLRWPAYDWTGAGYAVQGTCANCARTALVYVRRGHLVPCHGFGPECPYCGCARWVGWHAPEEEAPEKDMLAGLRAAAKIPHTPIDGDDEPSAGGREAALEEALRRCITVEHMDTHMPLAVRDAGKAALALTPTDAAKAVRAWREAAAIAATLYLRGADAYTGTEWEQFTEDELREIAALRPFGEGDA